MPMNPETHEMLVDCCPHCYQPLRRVLETGFTYCVDDFRCGYELGQHTKKPLTPSEAKERLLADSKRELDHQVDRMFSTIEARYGRDAAVQTIRETLEARLTGMVQKS